MQLKINNMDIRRKILKQQDTGQIWGAFKALVSSCSSYASWVSMSMQAVVLYTVTSPMMNEKNISIPFWVFCLIIVVLVIMLLTFEWKITIPSTMAFNNAQIAKHNSPIYQNTEKILEQNKKIMEKLGIKNDK